VRFVAASALLNLIWFLMTLPSLMGLVAAGVALYGQGSLFALGLWAAQRSAPAPTARLSRRTFAGLVVGQPLVAAFAGLFTAFSKLGGVFLLASILGGALVGVCLHWDTRASSERVFVAMLVVAAAWAGIPTAISRGWDVGVLHLGALGGPSDRTLHPLVTALWQVPMSGLVASWLISASQPPKHAEVG